MIYFCMYMHTKQKIVIKGKTLRVFVQGMEYFCFDISKNMIRVWIFR